MTTHDTDNRLTGEDWDRIEAAAHLAIARWAGDRSTTRAVTITEAEHGQTLYRLALQSIGCTSHDLTTEELRSIVAHIERAYIGRTWRRHLTRYDRAIDLTGPSSPAARYECEHCGNVIARSIDPIGAGREWAEVDSWGDDRDFQCGLSDNGQHTPGTGSA